MKLIYTLLAICLVTLSGCADFSEQNAMIAEGNTNKFVAFSDAMIRAAETEDSGDDIAIAMAFASGIGDHEFFRPETALDWMNWFSNFAGSVVLPGLNTYYQFNSNSKKSSVNAGRDVYIQSSRISEGNDIMNRDGTINIDGSTKIENTEQAE